MVQWPELWTRGAISLTSRWPSLVTNSSTHSTPTCSSAWTMRAAASQGSLGEGGRNGRRRESHVEDAVRVAGSRLDRSTPPWPATVTVSVPSALVIWTVPRELSSYSVAFS